MGSLEVKAVKVAGILVILLPAGNGSHTEFGIALGSGKSIYLYSPTNHIYDCDQTSTFYHVKAVHKFVGEFEDFIEYLLKEL